MTATHTACPRPTRPTNTCVAWGSSSHGFKNARLEQILDGALDEGADTLCWGLHDGAEVLRVGSTLYVAELDGRVLEGPQAPEETSREATARLRAWGAAPRSAS